MNGTSGANNAKVSASRVILVLLALTALWLTCRPSQAQGPSRREVVAEVRFEGLRNVPEEKARLYLRTKPGREFSQAEADEDVNRLAGSNLFRPLGVRTVDTTDGRVIVIFVVREFRGVVRDVLYKHANHIETKELENLTRIRPGMPMNKDLNKLAMFEVQEHLKKQGFYFAHVNLEEGGNDGDDRVIFNITEGPKIRVRSVNFVGQKELASAERIRTQIDTSRSFLYTFGGTFNPEMVNNDVTKIAEYYRNNGYYKVHVSREFNFSDDFQYVDIVFHIQEGERFRVHEHGVAGSKYFSKEQLESITTIKLGEYLTSKPITDDVRNLTNYIGYRGYQADVKEWITEVPGKPGLVKVQYVVDERPMSYVGEVFIVGNTVTQDRVIRRMLQGIQPGQVLSYPDLKVSEAMLARLNIFEMKPELGIRPTVQALDGPGPFKDILVKVQETRTGSLMFGAGLNSDSGLVGSVVLNERNFDLFRFPTSFADFWEGKAFRGAGQELRLEAMPGTVVQRYTASIREPFLFDQPYSLGLSGYYRDRIFEEYTENRWGGRITLGHQFTKEWAASIGARLEGIGVSNVPLGAPPDYSNEVGRHLLAAPNLTVAWDTRNSFLKPTEGGRVEFMFEQAFGANTFPIVNLEASRYFTIWQRPDGSGKHVLALRSQISWEGTQAPVYERFFGGGFMSIRGFEFRGVGPNVNGFMTGGQFQFINNIEYQIPIRANDNLYFVAFVDSGTVESKIGIHDYRVSAGFGLRINVPMLGPVPIALDFGFPIIRSATDRQQIFSFGISMNK